MKNLTLLLACFFVGLTYSQSDQGKQPLVQSYNQVRSFDLRSKDVVGSDYIIKNFMDAKINNKKYLVRFNAFKDEMEMKENNEIFILPKKEGLTITMINNHKTYGVYSYKNNKMLQNGFFVELFSNGKFNLLLKEKIKLYDEVKGKRGIASYQPPTLKRVRDKLYIGYSNNTAIEVPKKKKEFYALFTNNAKEVEKFIKSKKLKIKTKEDLVIIFNYAASLN